MKRTLLLALLCLALNANGQQKEKSSISQLVTLQLKSSSMITLSKLSPEKALILSSLTWIMQRGPSGGQLGHLNAKPVLHPPVLPVKSSYSATRTNVIYITFSPQ